MKEQRIKSWWVSTIKREPKKSEGEESPSLFKRRMMNFIMSKIHIYNITEIWYKGSGKQTGTATITAKVNGKTAKCKVTVSKPPKWSQKIWKNEVSDWTMEFSSQYTTVFKSNGTVCQTGWRNKDTGYYKVLVEIKLRHIITRIM